jgi:hypothetical protein
MESGLRLKPLEVVLVGVVEADSNPVGEQVLAGAGVDFRKHFWPTFMDKSIGFNVFLVLLNLRTGFNFVR